MTSSQRSASYLSPINPYSVHTRMGGRAYVDDWNLARAGVAGLESCVCSSPPPAVLVVLLVDIVHTSTPLHLAASSASLSPSFLSSSVVASPWPASCAGFISSSGVGFLACALLLVCRPAIARVCFAALRLRPTGTYIPATCIPVLPGALRSPLSRYHCGLLSIYLIHSDSLRRFILSLLRFSACDYAFATGEFYISLLELHYPAQYRVACMRPAQTPVLQITMSRTPPSSGLLRRADCCAPCHCCPHRCSDALVLARPSEVWFRLRQQGLASVRGRKSDFGLWASGARLRLAGRIVHPTRTSFSTSTIIHSCTSVRSACFAFPAHARRQSRLTTASIGPLAAHLRRLQPFVSRLRCH